MVAKRRFARVRRYAGRAAGGLQGKLVKVGVGAAGAIAAQFGARFHPTLGPAAGMGIVGYFANNDTLLTMTGMSLGQNIGAMFGGVGGNAGDIGWY